mgnify:FL=1
MVEIELKFLIGKDNLTDLLKCLEKQSFVISKTRIHELSVMYDNSDGLMQKTDGRIRVRQSGDKVELAYKKPISRKGIKKEIEYEVVISDLGDLQAILREMKFEPVSSYERYRTEYVLSNVKIALDEYPFASFIEIEGTESDIINVAKKLNFKLTDNLTDSCDTLFTKWREQKGLSPKPHMKFDDYDNGILLK